MTPESLTPGTRYLTQVPNGKLRIRHCGQPMADGFFVELADTGLGQSIDQADLGENGAPMKTAFNDKLAEEMGQGLGRDRILLVLKDDNFGG